MTVKALPLAALLGHSGLMTHDQACDGSLAITCTNCLSTDGGAQVHMEL